MRRESAKKEEEKEGKAAWGRKENENFNPKKTRNTQETQGVLLQGWAELSCVRDFPPPPGHRFISLNLPLFGHQLCNTAGWGEGRKYRKNNKIKINLRMAHKISLASYFQIIFFLFCATSSVTWAGPNSPHSHPGIGHTILLASASIIECPQSVGVGDGVGGGWVDPACCGLSWAECVKV